MKELGVVFTSRLIEEHDRDANGKMTHWKTGRRFAYITLSKEPLPKTLDMGPFTAALYHKEQKTVDKQNEAECRRCFQKGHRSDECLAPIKCRQCYKDGHKAGDPECSLAPTNSGTAGIAGGQSDNITNNDLHARKNESNDNEKIINDDKSNENDDVDDNADKIANGVNESEGQFNVPTDKPTNENKQTDKTINLNKESGAISKVLPKLGEDKRGRKKTKDVQALGSGQTKLAFRREGSGSLKRNSRDLEEGELSSTNVTKVQKLNSKGNKGGKSKSDGEHLESELDSG